ncbi:MAG: T9SS type A sorting domain-containing protein, partial [Taibaiella sp.]|nr:T9SS type A sorting domain-containing protein [Taibaiella sp.]
GTLGSGADEAVNADVTDMLGQVVYRGILQAKRGKLDEQIRLSNTLANGMYILTLRTEQEQKVFHFVMQQ